MATASTSCADECVGGLPVEPELQLSFLANETLVWQQGPTIGSGRFGQVVLALRVPSADFLAVKQIYIQEEVEQGNDTSSLSMQRVLPLAKIEREVDIVQNVQHPNIVRFLGFERFGSMYRIFMEHIPAGSVSKLLKELGPFPEAAARHFTQQLTEGVAYLHRVGVAHRDLKCANLLLADDGTVKIADFGSAACSTRSHEHAETDDDEFAHEHETARSVRDGLGSPYWMAPELVRAERGANGWCKADVWGIGCVLIELVTGKPPWENHSNPLTAMFHIASKDATPPLSAALSAGAKSFLRGCFVKDPNARPSAGELLLHPFLTGDSGALAQWQDQSPQASAERTGKLDVSHPVDEPSASPAEPQPSELRLSSSAVSESSASVDSPSNRSSTGSADASEAGEIATLYSSDEASGDEGISSGVAQSPWQELPVSRRPSASSFAWGEIGRVRALADYTAGDANELSLKEGQTLIVAGVNEFGWWRGKHMSSGQYSAAETVEVGWFPCTYVEWIPTSTPFSVRRVHVPSPTLARDAESTELTLAFGHLVLVAHCEWRDDGLWAYGSMSASGNEGWFPFSCVVDDRT